MPCNIIMEWEGQRAVSEALPTNYLLLLSMLLALILSLTRVGGDKTKDIHADDVVSPAALLDSNLIRGVSLSSYHEVRKKPALFSGRDASNPQPKRVEGRVGKKSIKKSHDVPRNTPRPVS
jgi:hypothetical protein